MNQLEALEQVTLLRLSPTQSGQTQSCSSLSSPDHVTHSLDHLPALAVVAPGPVVPGPAGAPHQVLRPEHPAQDAAPQSLHRAWLQVHHHGPRHVLLSSPLRVEDIDPVQLVLVAAPEPALAVQTVLDVEVVPEGGTDLVPALTDLETPSWLLVTTEWSLTWRWISSLMLSYLAITATWRYLRLC